MSLLLYALMMVIGLLTMLHESRKPLTIHNQVTYFMGSLLALAGVVLFVLTVALNRADSQGSGGDPNRRMHAQIDSGPEEAVSCSTSLESPRLISIGLSLLDSHFASLHNVQS